MPDSSSSSRKSHPEQPGLTVPGTLSPSPTGPSEKTTEFLAGPDALPRPFGRYILLQQLGQGGMGTVYLAQDPILDRRIALKVPHPEVLRLSQALDRFYREARAAARLNHRNICPIFDVGAWEGQHYLTMAFIEGESLADWIDRLAGQDQKIAELIRTLARALDEAHREGIIHRDLKPHNILLDRRGEPVIMDFGLARHIDSEESTRTGHGVILGTPAYMPPEQATGNAALIGPTSDIYSLGVILYEMLTGRVPFQGPSTAVLVQVVYEPPPAPSSLRPGLDPRLEAICLKAMAKQVSDRFASMAEFASALDDFLAGRTLTVTPSTPSTPTGRLLDSILRELRRWGWEKGLSAIKQWLPQSRELPIEESSRLLHWLEGERSVQEQILEQYRTEPLIASLLAWVQAGRAVASLRVFQVNRAHKEIDEASSTAHAPDRILDGILSYLRGFILAREGKWGEAIPVLHEALELLGREHLLTGGVLDALGRVYAGKCNFQAACEFYNQAIACKKAAADDSGLVLSHEELGRIHIDCEQFDQAEQQLEAGLLVAQRCGDELGQARVLNHLGRVALFRGEHETEAGKKSAARKLFKQAAEYLDFAIKTYSRLDQPVPQGRALKYVAMICLYDGKFDEAEQHLRHGEQLLTTAGHPLGLVEIQRHFARLRLAQGRTDEALQLFRHSVIKYDALSQPLEATRTQFELAQALAQSGSPGRLALRAFQDALERAEACRRADLVEKIEEALKGIDEEAHWKHVFRRVRGQGACESTASLHDGESETVSILSLELHEFVSFCQGMDPQTVMLTLNQMLADLEVVLERHRAPVTSYLGGGFMAMLRGENHAERAVTAALELLQVVAEFNRPRATLGLRLLPARIGVASGPVFIGNVGTYRKMEFSAVGPPVNLASSLMRRSVSHPLISQETHELVGERFLYGPGSPCSLEVVGIGQRLAWEVLARVPRSTPGPSRV